MSLFLLNNKTKFNNPVDKFGKDLSFWISPTYSKKTFNGSSISQIYDLSKNKKNAVQSTAIYQPAYVSSDYLGLSSLKFDATNSQKMSISSLGISGIQTLVSFIKMNGSGATRTLFAGANWNVSGWQAVISSNLTIQGCISGTAWQTVYAFSSYLNNYAHLVIVVDNIALKVKVYVNGVKIGTDYTMPYSYTERVGECKIGDFWGGTTTGNIYNMYLVNREMTSTEVLQDYYNWTRYKA
jgi:hypothetical protein